MAIRSVFRVPRFSMRTTDFIRRILIALLIATIFLAGIQLRRWIGDTTRHVRYQHDIVNGFYWGSEVLKQARRVSPDESSANSWPGFCRGYFALYDRVKDKAYKNDYGLDYPPLRLLVMAIWAKQVRSEFPGVDDGHPKLVSPLLKVNLLCELLSAVAIFRLVRLCVRRSSWATGSSALGKFPQQRGLSLYLWPASARYSCSKAGRATQRPGLPVSSRAQSFSLVLGMAAASPGYKLVFSTAANITPTFSLVRAITFHPFCPILAGR